LTWLLALMTVIRKLGRHSLARGLSTPSGGVHSARGLPRRISRAVTRTCSHTRVRAFTALTQQGRATTLTRLGIMSRRCFANSQGRPSPPLFSTVRRGQCQLRDTVLPAPVRLTRRTLEGGAGGTLKYLLRAYAGPHRDVGPAGSVIPIVVSPVRPSPPLQHHAGRCGDIPVLLGRTGTRHHHDGRSTNYYAAALEAAPVRAQDAPRRLNGSETHQDGRQLRSTVRHTATRVEIVRHAC
jgi:hypothetical protein